MSYISGKNNDFFFFFQQKFQMLHELLVLFEILKFFSCASHFLFMYFSVLALSRTL